MKQMIDEGERGVTATKGFGARPKVASPVVLSPDYSVQGLDQLPMLQALSYE